MGNKDAWYNREEFHNPESVIKLAEQEKKRIDFFSNYEFTDEMKKKYPDTYKMFKKFIPPRKELYDVTIKLVETILGKRDKLDNLKKEYYRDMQELIHEGLSIYFRSLIMVACIEGLEEAKNWR